MGFRAKLCSTSRRSGGWRGAGFRLERTFRSFPLFRSLVAKRRGGTPAQFHVPFSRGKPICHGAFSMAISDICED